MNAHVLDRPIWSALTSKQADFARGDSRAVRFPPDVSPFIATRDDSEESLAKTVELVAQGTPSVRLQNTLSPVPPGLVAESVFAGVQMVAASFKPAYPSDEIIPLGDADAPEMVALATLTQPGPFLIATCRLGGYIGIRKDGKLVAMAGQRLWLDGYCEVSAVCTHPDYRGRGYAGLLTRIVATRIAERGETPFLHTFAANDGAIRLYEALGFRHRCDMTIQVLTRG